MYAIVATGGKQYKVAPGDKLNIEKLLDVTINSCEHYRSMCN